MIRLMAYQYHVREADMEFRVFRQNNRGTVVPMEVALLVAIAAKRGGHVRPGPGLAVVADIAGLRAIKRYYVDVEGDVPVFYGADGMPQKTVCAAVRTFFGYVPDGINC